MNAMTRRTACCTILSLLLAAPASARLIQIDGPRVWLTDLIGAASPRIDMGRAPEPGSRRVVQRWQVLAALGDGAARRLPRTWTVQTRVRRMPCSALRQRVIAALAPRLRPGLRVTHLDCRRPLLLPAGPLRLDARLTGRGRLAGRLPVEISLEIGGWPARRVYASVTVEGSVAVLVATRDISRGEHLVGSMVRLERRAAASLPSDALFGGRQIAGTRAAGRIARGALLRRGVLTAIPVIQRGAAVTITATLEGVRVSGRGIARQDGGMGEMVMVLNKASHKVIRARVTGPHHVVVDL